ncbi:hypothetical protein VAE151_560844 [Vibrio aestuarianus]|uniref:Uncharacterized protein n=2 Tax=Vibrio aestuarianus TaxID=28171 RepID=A0ABM9FT64_9VIBR|nr:hypothetical protein VAE308_1051488 [Vibrio aestuarianus]CAH8211236.1 hypothetical protein VAE055_380837 [Vibrio aestuarianus]CAH8211252.1 hypothetical protein VAE032_271485 [Vibrio aestuarianus]CAH8211439.1 hypothetical protein VAE128_461489 [Vibrio aestuarianus]CAH8211607.1 hypothetical protein VAE130_571484 [Vibrio aestuarianus]
MIDGLWVEMIVCTSEPLLVVVYVRLAKREEFGDDYRHYMESTPGWIPKMTID